MLRRAGRYICGGRYLASARCGRLAALTLGGGLLASGVFAQSMSAATTKLLPPSLLTPANASTATTLTPTFSWQAAAGTTSYRLQVTASSDTSFRSPVINKTMITTSLLSPISLRDKSSYRWRVQSINGTTTSSWSTVWSFTISLPPTVTLTASPIKVPVGRRQHFNLELYECDVLRCQWCMEWL
jgi:hypothetical protein